MYKFSVFDFSSSEIDQIVMVVTDCSEGRISPYDARVISKQVKDYALSWGLLEKKDERLFCGPLTLNLGRSWAHRELPVEAVWRIVKPMFEGKNSIGFSLASKRGWLRLNIYPEKHRRHTQQDMEHIIDTLSYLADHGYVYVQMAGSIWEINILERGAGNNPATELSELKAGVRRAKAAGDHAAARGLQEEIEKLEDHLGL